MRHGAHGRRDNLCHHARFKRGGQHAGGGVSSHTAGIRPNIAIADALMILRRSKGDNIASIGQGKKARLFAPHKFFKHNFGTRRAKATAEHILNRVACLSLGFGDDHALASRQPIGLDDDRQAKARHICKGGGLIIMAGISGSGDMGASAQILGEAL